MSSRLVPAQLVSSRLAREIRNIDSGQSYLRLRIGSFSIEFLKKSIDSGQCGVDVRCEWITTKAMPSLQNIADTNGKTI